VQINSHTQGEYLDEPKFEPIFRALADTGQPLYIHPATPPDSMIGPMLDAWLDGAIFGFGVETGMHLLRLITTGIFDRYPDLQIMVGHAGEALPYWAYRLDYMHAAGIRSGRYDFLKPLQLPISGYFKRNIYVTFSGVAWEPAIQFCKSTLGVERIMYAMDYPYQYHAEEVAAQDAMAMSAQDKKAFFQTNAEKVFNL
jgi:2,3-dihydroxybenzoate decarboxylase